MSVPYGQFDLLAGGGTGDDEAAARLRKAESVGRPVGSAAFIARPEDMTRRRLRPVKRGPKGRDEAVSDDGK
jgi:hypothetical protein